MRLTPSDNSDRKRIKQTSAYINRNKLYQYVNQDNIKMNLKQALCSGCEAFLAQDRNLVADSCEHGHALTGFHQLIHYKNYHSVAPWTWHCL